MYNGARTKTGREEKGNGIFDFRPLSTLHYVVLLGDQVAREGATGSESVVTAFCRRRAYAEGCWYGMTKKVDARVEQQKKTYSEGSVAERLNIMQKERDATIENNF